MPLLEKSKDAVSIPITSPMNGPKAAGAPPRSPLITGPSAADCSSEALSSTSKPTRQLPSAILPGVSATTAHVRPPTSTPSTSPELQSKTMTAWQRSLSAGSAKKLAAHGQRTSQLQFSK